jgi:hypothetical protein
MYRDILSPQSLELKVTLTAASGTLLIYSPIAWLGADRQTILCVKAIGGRLNSILKSYRWKVSIEAIERASCRVLPGNVDANG